MLVFLVDFMLDFCSPKMFLNTWFVETKAVWAWPPLPATVTIRNNYGFSLESLSTNIINLHLPLLLGGGPCPSDT